MQFTVAVLGAGRVGSTIAAAWVRAGAQVWLADVNKERIESIERGYRVFRDEPCVDDSLQEAKGKLLQLTYDPSEAVRNADNIFIAVPVGLKNGKADFTNLKSVADSISKSIHSDLLITLETSVPPGTTRNFLKRRIESVSKKKAGRDFLLAYSPERISEGRALADLEENYAKIVSGFDELSLEKISSLYSRISRKGVIKMSSLEAAEAEKLFEGIYRDVNIALANELASFCEDSGLDYWEIMNASNSQPYCHLHRPGSGVGGACIPVYPVFVYTLAEKMHKELKLVKTAREINDSQPYKVAEQAIALAKLKPGDRVSILGLAFRGDVADDRLSPAYEISSYLKRKGMKITVHDPIAEPSISNNVFDFTHSIEAALKGANLIIISADHTQYKKIGLRGLNRINPEAFIYDARGIFREKADSGKKLFTLGIGRKKLPMS